MKTVAMIGNYSAEVPLKIRKKLPDEFNIIEVQKYEEFGKLEEADYIILRTLKLDEKAINNLKKAKLIHRWGSGYDSVDIQAAGKRGIAVLAALGVNAVAVAEHCVLLMLALYRHIIEINNMMFKGIWDRQKFLDQSYLLKGKTIGLIGCGSVGKLVAERIYLFGVKSIYYDILRLPFELEQKLKLEFVPLERLLSISDIISIHIPATESTVGMIGRKQFKMMKPTAIIVNTSRGSVLNESDLVKTLQNRQLLGAGLDCFETEPLPKDSPLLSLDNVILTPHIGGNTRDINDEMIDCVLGNILKSYNGEDLSEKMLVNSQYLK